MNTTISISNFYKAFFKTCRGTSMDLRINFNDYLLHLVDTLAAKNDAIKCRRLN